jgi:integrase
VKEATLRNDREVLKAVQRTGLANESVVQLNMDAIRRHCEARAGGGAQVVSYNRDLRVIKCALNWALRTGLIERMPPVELNGLSSVRDDEEPRTLTRKEQGRLLAACDFQLRTIVALCLFSGLRRGEALSLQARDVDLKAGVLHIRGKRLEDGSRWSPKSKQRRIVPVGRRLHWYLTRYIHLERGRMEPDDWLFLRGSDGGRLRSVEDRVRKAYRRAGMEPQGLHVCRRTYATTLAENGANAEVIRRLGGWSSLEVVQRSYFNVGLDALRSAVDQVG